MVPLLERHFSLPMSDITTKGVNSEGNHPQPSYKHAEEVADICISLRETCRLLQGSPGPHPLPLGRSLPCHPFWPCCYLQGPSGHTWVTPGEVHPLPSHYLYMESPEYLPELIKVKSPNIPGQVQLRLIIGWGSLGEDQVSTSSPWATARALEGWLLVAAT